MSDYDEMASLAESILEFRPQRSRVFPKEIFGELAWELLLEVFIADARGDAITARMAVAKNAGAGAVMSRWLKYLTAEGLLLGDGDGNLDDELVLSGKGMKAIEEILIVARDLKLSLHSTTIPNK